jgi:hypothetical protein
MEDSIFTAPIIESFNSILFLSEEETNLLEEQQIQINKVKSIQIFLILSKYF